MATTPTKVLPATVLVTTDLSRLGDAALPHAAALARAHGARLVLLSVVETPAPPSPLYAHYYPPPPPAEVSRGRARLLQELEKRAKGLAKAGVKVQCVVSDGDPAAEIIRAAKALRAKAVAISTHGRTGLKHFLLGSVAERVLKGTKVPVLLVR
jgi:nucleotide-binding universal stress UspA family protein